MGGRSRKKNSVKNFILCIILMICVILMFYSGYKIIAWVIENNRSKEIMHEINENAVIKENDKYKVDIQKLKKINSETVGWVKVENTNIEYPVVQTSDNNYYLTHSFDKTYNRAGWIFADFRNKLDDTDKNIIIYGHNRRDGSMFGSLKNTLEEEWYNNKENMRIYLQIGEQGYEYEIFSLYQILQEEYYLTTDFDKKEDFEKYINRAKAKSKKDFNVDVSIEDKLLTLSTCANNNNYRVVVHAKRLINQ